MVKGHSEPIEVSQFWVYCMHIINIHGIRKDASPRETKSNLLRLKHYHFEHRVTTKEGLLGLKNHVKLRLIHNYRQESKPIYLPLVISTGINGK